MANNARLIQEITTFLATKSLTPNTTWLTTNLATLKPDIHLQGAKQLIYIRLLNTSLQSTIQITPSSIFPQDILNGNITSRLLKGPIPVQVMDIEDIGKSRWSQLEAIEADERGETTRGQEIVRVVRDEEDAERDQSATQTSSPSSGPHKLLLQDAKGLRVYGFELSTVTGINMNIHIGCKLVLRDVSVARGVILLEPKSVTVAGGKIEELHQTWKAGRKENLKRMANAGSSTQGG
ncbi:hypothetical protein BT63DRAFT_311668 [Microthyrium microscopicum]|uniref:RecQ-mediated genome instability protein 1 n=1 Tax=Microthyrium microscopicum TaxID=703497 RepID=A0A6A6U2Q9_9PEZI|nr:hypothetical protein BT63DRAFT_311668 [Microthyrium microscopicum]